MLRKICKLSTIQRKAEEYQLKQSSPILVYFSQASALFNFVSPIPNICYWMACRIYVLAQFHTPVQFFPGL